MSNSTMAPLTPILKKKTSNKIPVNSNKKVNFQTNITAHDIILQYRHSNNESVYKGILEEISTTETVELLIKWLSEMTSCVPMLDRRVENLVLEFLKVPWFKFNEDVSERFHNFLISLVTAHNYYNYSALQILFAQLLPDFKTLDHNKAKSEPGVISDKEQKKYDNILENIVAIHKEVPLCQDSIMKFARKSRPYFKVNAHIHLIYTRNLLQLSIHIPQLRSSLLEIIIANMITLDVRSPRSELDEEDDFSDNEDQFDMEVDEPVLNNNSISMEHETGNTLDLLMQLMLHHIHNYCHGQLTIPLDLHKSTIECQFNLNSSKIINPKTSEVLSTGCHCGGTHHNMDMIKSLYLDLRTIFARFILPTHNTAHVQFLLFYMVAIRPGLVTSFLDFLYEQNFKSVNCVRDIRQNSILYFGSLLARAKFISFQQSHSWLEMLCNWCHSYLENQERLESNCYQDIVMHSTFYYACQTIFYVFTFRYSEYTSPDYPKRLNLAQGLGMNRLVSCKLNPLKVCSTPVVNNFAAVTRRFELVYCYTIMMNNKRLNIPTVSLDKRNPSESLQTCLMQFFPFDPYLLKRSKVFINKHYREFGGLPDDCEKGEESDSELEEMDEDIASLTATPKSFSFSYGSCDGYKR